MRSDLCASLAAGHVLFNDRDDVPSGEAARDDREVGNAGLLIDLGSSRPRWIVFGSFGRWRWDSLKWLREDRDAISEIVARYGHIARLAARHPGVGDVRDCASHRANSVSTRASNQAGKKMEDTLGKRKAYAQSDPEQNVSYKLLHVFSADCLLVLLPSPNGNYPGSSGLHCRFDQGCAEQMASGPCRLEMIEMKYAIVRRRRSP